MLDLARAAKKRVADRHATAATETVAEPAAPVKEEEKVAEAKDADPVVKRREEAKAAQESPEIETVSHVLGSI